MSQSLKKDIVYIEKLIINNVVINRIESEVLN